MDSAQKRRSPRLIATPQPGELPDEFALRKLVAKARLSAAKAALGIHAAADTGRRNKDWRANNGSADLAIITDGPILLARSRQLVRDTWAGKSIVRAACRNVVGKGITVIPNAKGSDGKPLTALNAAAQGEWDRWRKSKSCDVERKQTFSQKQRLASKEKTTAGEHLWLWSYKPNIRIGVGVDRSKPVGMQLQAFEPEQFDQRIQSYEGREVRGGVEVDLNGAPVAYHLYTRNPNDVLYRFAFLSERVSADRMFHYFEGERVLQTRGVTCLTPVMQDIRDLGRIQGATLTRSLMESYIGLIIKQQNVTSGIGTLNSSTIAPAAGDTGQTPTGMTTADFAPGMVANLAPGEEVESFIPSSPGNQYDPFVTLTARGIGAGVGMSFGQIMRQNDGSYSAARQDMLEDRKEWEPEQELIVDDLIRPTYELWFSFAVLEGRFDDVEGFSAEDFEVNRHRYVAADYIPPPQTWIDPEKEARAFAILLENRLITREEIVAMRGGRFLEVIAKLAEENRETDALHLSLPENAEAVSAIRDLVKAIMTNKQGTVDSVAFNLTDVADMLQQAGLKVRSSIAQPLLPVVAAPGLTATGDPVENKAGQIIGGGIKPPPPGTMPAAGSQKPAAAAGQLNASISLPVFAPDAAPPPPPAGARPPAYRPSVDGVLACATCSYQVAGACRRFDVPVETTAVCDDWAAATLTENTGVADNGKSLPPGPQPGQRPLEDRFFPAADTTVRPGI